MPPPASAASSTTLRPKMWVNGQRCRARRSSRREGRVDLAAAHSWIQLQVVVAEHRDLGGPGDTAGRQVERRSVIVGTIDDHRSARGRAPPEDMQPSAAARCHRDEVDGRRRRPQGSPRWRRPAWPTSNIDGAGNSSSLRASSLVGLPGLSGMTTPPSPEHRKRRDGERDVVPRRQRDRSCPDARRRGPARSTCIAAVAPAQRHRTSTSVIAIDQRDSDRRRVRRSPLRDSSRAPESGRIAPRSRRVTSMSRHRCRAHSGGGRYHADSGRRRSTQ